MAAGSLLAAQRHRQRARRHGGAHQGSGAQDHGRSRRRPRAQRRGVAGVRAACELPMVWAVAKGLLVNNAILVPAALAISAAAPWASARRGPQARSRRPSRILLSAPHVRRRPVQSLSARSARPTRSSAPGAKGRCVSSGSLFVRDAAQLERVRRAGPMNVLRAVAMPRGSLPRGAG
jgi:hypothetical protein